MTTEVRTIEAIKADMVKAINDGQMQLLASYQREYAAIEKAEREAKALENVQKLCGEAGLLSMPNALRDALLALVGSEKATLTISTTLQKDVNVRQMGVKLSSGTKAATSRRSSGGGGSVKITRNDTGQTLEGWKAFIADMKDNPPNGAEGITVPVRGVPDMTLAQWYANRDEQANNPEGGDQSSAIGKSVIKRTAELIEGWDAEVVR